MTIQTSLTTLRGAALARPAAMATTGAGWRARRAAFTMIELMVVLGIIGILVALLVLVGGRVAGTGKQSATLSMIKALDSTLGAVTQDRGRLPRPLARDSRSDLSDPEFWPIADGTIADSPGAELINSAGWFLQLASEIPGASDLTGVDPELLRVYEPAIGGATPRQPQLTTPMDAWGNPIRMVHPTFDGNLRGLDLQQTLGPAPDGGRYINGVSVTRIGAAASEAELTADGGFAPGNQPYFYSAGPDGKVGVVMNGDQVVEDFNEDNVYSAKPEFDRESP